MMQGSEGQHIRWTPASASTNALLYVQSCKTHGHTHVTHTNMQEKRKINTNSRNIEVNEPMKIMTIIVHWLKNLRHLKFSINILLLAFDRKSETSELL